MTDSILPQGAKCLVLFEWRAPSALFELRCVQIQDQPTRLFVHSSGQRVPFEPALQVHWQRPLAHRSDRTSWYLTTAQGPHGIQIGALNYLEREELCAAFGARNRWSMQEASFWRSPAFEALTRASQADAALHRAQCALGQAPPERSVDASMPPHRGWEFCYVQPRENIAALQCATRAFVNKAPSPRAVAPRKPAPDARRARPPEQSHPAPTPPSPTHFPALPAPPHEQHWALSGW